MQKKYRTGDIFLANRHSIESILIRKLDPDCKWTEVGLFDVRQEEGRDAIVSVFLLTKDGAKLVPLDAVLRDPTIEMAAHRSFIHRDKNALATSIKYAMNKLAGSARAQIFSDDDQNRESYTPAQLTARILSSIRLMPYPENISTSYFQQYGPADEHYDLETVMYPRNTDIDVVKAILESAYVDAGAIILNHIKTSNANSLPVQASSSTEPEYDGNPTQMPTLMKSKKKNANKLAEVNASDSITRRLNKKKEDGRLYMRPVPK